MDGAGVLLKACHRRLARQAARALSLHGYSTTKDVKVVSIAPLRMPTCCRLPHEENDRNDSMRLARHGRCRQAPQDVGTHQGDSKAKGTRCVPSATLRSSRRRHTSACSPCLPPRDRLGGEDARRQTKRSFRAMTFWAWLRPYQSRLTGDRVGRCPLRCDAGKDTFPCILMHARPCLQGAPMP